MKKILFILFSLASFDLYAQTGIGTTTPNASAKLDVYSTDKGFLPPRVTLAATNSASPITSPANGLMVFNTVTAGSSPNQVVPGYYYWNGTSQQWVSLSTTVGNVQNQGIFRSTASATAGAAVSSWSSRFNNIAAGDLTVTSNTTFSLSNGIYKIQWGLPHQTTQTYNAMQLQENLSGTWTAFRNDANLANIANGGNTDWGGTSFMTDIIDCSSSTKTLRLINSDGSRALLLGASFIITKLNSDINTSTTADNLGNHTATKNILLNGNYLSNDGGNEGIRIDNSGNVGLGTNTPTAKLNIGGGGVRIASGLGNTSTRPSVNTSTIGNYEIRGVGGGASQNDTQDDGFLRLSAGGGTSAIQQSSIDLSGYSATVPDMNSTIVMRTAGTERVRIDNSGNVNITGKINVTDASGNVVKKVTGFVNAGDYIILDNLKARVAPSGNRSLQVATVSGTYTVFGSNLYSANGAGGTTIFENSKLTITTDPAYLNAGLHFVWGGYTDTWTIMDTNNFLAWRITCIIGNTYGAYANFISIERLL